MKTEEQITELVANALNSRGVSAAPQNTGGEISCVVVPVESGGEIVWGTADVNWGAVVIDSQGQITSSLQTRCPSDVQNIDEIVAAITGPSIRAGAMSAS